MVVLSGLRPSSATAGQPELRRYETPYYLIYTDLEGPDAAEGVVRMRVLGDALRQRTRALGFTGRIDRRLPVYLFRNREDYLATGAPPESAGAFLGDRLVAAATGTAAGAPDRAPNRAPNRAPAWHVVQHEAFHQFAAAVRGPDLPGWLNEGLGEYFGESLFTGDGYVSGVAPAWRVARVRQSVRGGAYPPLQRLLQLSQEQWNERVDLARYDQAWSVVQFVLHAPGGGGERALAGCVAALAKGTPAGEAWREHLGDAADFERRWRDYWAGDAAESADLYARAAVAAVTSLLARAVAAGQSFATFDDFLAAASRGALRCREEDWVPPSLLQRALKWAPEGSRWSLEGEGERARVVLTRAGGAREVGTFTLREGRVREVSLRSE